MTALVFGIASWALLLSVAGAQAEVPEGDEEALRALRAGAAAQPGR